MEQILTFDDGKEILPHTINYLKVLGIEVRPKDDTLNRSVAVFNMDGIKLTPKSTSQSGWWLQTPIGVLDRIIVVSEKHISFETNRHKHVYLGILEKTPCGFSITTTMTDLGSSIIRVSTNQVNAVRVEIKQFGSDQFDCYDIVGGENLGQVDQIINSIIDGYKKEIDVNSLDNLLFLAMLADYRLHQGIKAYINRVYKSKEALKADFVTKVAAIELNREAAHKAVDNECNKKIKALEQDYEDTWDAMFKAEEQPLGVIKIKH